VVGKESARGKLISAPAERPLCQGTQRLAAGRGEDEVRHRAPVRYD